MKFTRQIKLASIHNDFMTDEAKNIISDLDTVFGNLNIYKNDGNKESLYYGKDINNIFIEHYNYNTTENNGMWIYYDFGNTLYNIKIKYNIDTVDLKYMIYWYLNKKYNIVLSDKPAVNILFLTKIWFHNIIYKFLYQQKL